MDSEEGPLPVYKKKGMFFSYASRIPSRSLQERKKQHITGKVRGGGGRCLLLTGERRTPSF